MDNKDQKKIQINQDAFKGKEIEFPVSFILKAVMNAGSSDKVNKDNIEKVLNNLKISNSFTDSKQSSKGTYTSYHYKVNIESKQQLETMYESLKNVEGLKFAL